MPRKADGKSESSLRRHKKKEEDPEGYAKDLPRAKERYKKRKEEREQRWSLGTRTAENEKKAYYARSREKNRRSYWKNKSPSVHQTRTSSLASTSGRTSGYTGKRRRDMADEEKRLHDNAVRKKRLDSRSSQKKSADRKRHAAYMKELRAKRLSMNQLPPTCSGASAPLTPYSTTQARPNSTSVHFEEGSEDPVSACASDRPRKRRKAPEQREPFKKRVCLPSDFCVNGEAIEGDLNRPGSSTSEVCLTDKPQETITSSSAPSTPGDSMDLPQGANVHSSDQAPSPICQDTSAETPSSAGLGQTEPLDLSFTGPLPNFHILLDKAINDSHSVTSTSMNSNGTLFRDFSNCGHIVELTMTNELFTKIQREKFIENATKNDANCFYYTGVPTITTLNVFSWLKSFLHKIKLWDGSRTCRKYKGRQRLSLTYYEEFFLCLIRIRRGFDVTVLSYNFGISRSQVSKVFIAWVYFLRDCFDDLLIWPSKALVRNNLPDSFSSFPSTRAIIDCTEYFTQKPIMPHAQRCTYSTYKQANTFKQLVAIMPSGAIIYVSKLYAGNVSDLSIVKKCGFLDKVQPGDDIMADRGFNIRHLLLQRQATLNIPSFTHGKALGLKAVKKIS